MHEIDQPVGDEVVFVEVRVGVDRTRRAPPRAHVPPAPLLKCRLIEREEVEHPISHRREPGSQITVQHCVDLALLPLGVEKAFLLLIDRIRRILIQKLRTGRIEFVPSWNVRSPL